MTKRTARPKPIAAYPPTVRAALEMQATKAAAALPVTLALNEYNTWLDEHGLRAGKSRVDG